MTEWSWTGNMTVLVGQPQAKVQKQGKLALFDLDHTLIKPKNNRKFPKKLKSGQTDGSDWEPYFPVEIVKPIMAKLVSRGFTPVIVSNQSCSKDWESLMGDEFTNKVVALCKLLEIADCCWIFVATKGVYRKPSPGLGRIFRRQGLLDKTSDIAFTEDAFFCGDAAGRYKLVKGKKKKVDFADTDRKFAINLGIHFYTPEEFFLQQKDRDSSPSMPYELTYPNIQQILQRKPNYLTTLNKLYDPDLATLYLMVGFPASGKSWFATRYLETMGVQYVNRDTLKTMDRCVAKAKECMKEKTSLVVDNTNLDIKTRRDWIDLALKYKFRIVCFNFPPDLELIRHNMIFRAIRDKTRPPIPDIAMRMMVKRYESPTMAEGFAGLADVQFVPRLSEAAIDLYTKYLY
jgi:bifunctional polynucleotide phosphatase/kinase